MCLPAAKRPATYCAIDPLILVMLRLVAPPMLFPVIARRAAWKATDKRS